MLRHPVFIVTSLMALAWLFFAPSAEDIAASEGVGLEYPGYAVKPVESFSIEARILSRENYSYGREADLSPTDLALGWGPMADESVVSQFEISQRNRWYFWKTSTMPIPRGDVIRHSANVHIIPGNAGVRQQLEDVREDDHVRLVGKLVDIDAEDGWRWRTSRSRSDTGNGSCELLWLERIELI